MRSQSSDHDSHDNVLQLGTLMAPAWLQATGGVQARVVGRVANATARSPSAFLISYNVYYVNSSRRSPVNLPGRHEGEWRARRHSLKKVAFEAEDDASEMTIATRLGK
jgi:hypothetical protein